ncbi:pyridoxal 5'-phosphate synthase (glutamine hydrolyzing) [Malassezia yamatoensis]|uniref:glutaminase n=1 Tax=Malassezia yamatoensis TaxID=253288 RepID=A0AAJ6CHE9_9BASI|nr:pyridoxal 5'-phosphate synthase (glutamine hydrolyzing) [Malassezia yamatoensis]
MPNTEKGVTVGVLALQGAFQEHIARFNSLNAGSFQPRVRAIAVRRPDQLEQCDGLVLPGGESTAISLGLLNAQLMEPLRKWISDQRPVWGTCAGMIMLATIASGGKRGGQELLGGLDIQVGRNGFGSQVCSFEAGVKFPVLGEDDYPGVFIRAPVVEKLLGDAETQRRDAVADPGSATKTLSISVCPESALQIPNRPLEVLGYLPPSAVPDVAAPDFFQSANTAKIHGAHPPKDAHIVAVRQGRLIATSFHPELTGDTRLHAYFVREIIQNSC